MRKIVFILAAGTSIAMLAAAVAVVEFSVSTTTAFSAVLIAFLMVATVLVWHNKKDGSSSSEGEIPQKSRTALKWLFFPFLIGAIGGLVMALQEGWNAGDTIGAAGFGVFAFLIAFELLRRKRATRTGKMDESQ